MLEKFTGCVVCLLDLSWRTLVNRYVATSTTTGSKEWNLEKLIFHKPFEVLAKIAIDKENIECSLMIAYEYIALIVIYILSSFYFYRKE